jgi:hypothetical protein
MPHPSKDGPSPGGAPGAEASEDNPEALDRPQQSVAGSGDDTGSAEGQGEYARSLRRPLRTTMIVLAASVVAGAAGLTATGSLGGGDTNQAAAAATGPVRTATVAKTSLTRSETVDGTLGYGDATVVQAPPADTAESGDGNPGTPPPTARPAPRATPTAGTPDQPPGVQPTRAPSSPEPRPTPTPASPSSTPTPSRTSGLSGPNAQLAAATPIATGSTAQSGRSVLTHLPGDGDVIKRGGSVYSVDEQKVPLLYGAIPLYRLLKTGTEGEDVAMLEKNLAALGYTGFTVDDTYDSATAAVVKQWQHDLGRTESGTVQPGDAVVAPGARRVADVKATLGGALAGELLTWTGTARMVEVDLDTQYEDLVKDGTKASVKLPDGTTVGAEVSRVGTAATAASSPAGGNSGGGTGDATLPVDLAVKDQSRLGRYQAAPVEVTLTAETHEDVLAVPVNALIARPGRGYAVQAVTASGVEDRAVKVGLFADGLVEVSGAGITAGLKVGIPQ